MSYILSYTYPSISLSLSLTLSLSHLLTVCHTQQHVDDVRAIVQRAVKDLAIENALKTYEEVWLSKVFELRGHVRNKISQSADVTQDNQSEYSQSEAAGPVSAARTTRTTSRISNQSSHSKNKRSVQCGSHFSFVVFLFFYSFS